MLDNKIYDLFHVFMKRVEKEEEGKGLCDGGDGVCKWKWKEMQRGGGLKSTPNF